MKTILKLMPHAKAYVEKRDNGSYDLISYDTLAATISFDGWLTIKCWCSPTTRRHIVAFIDEYVHLIATRKEQSEADLGTYQTAKALYESHMKLDIHTGEIVDLTGKVYTYNSVSEQYTEETNLNVNYIIHNLPGVTVMKEENGLVQILADKNAVDIIEWMYDLDMIVLYPDKTIFEVEANKLV